MSGHASPVPPRPVWIRVSGIVEKRHVGTAVELAVVPTPPSTILRIESEDSATQVVARLAARGLDVLGIRPVT